MIVVWIFMLMLIIQLTEKLSSLWFAWSSLDVLPYLARLPSLFYVGMVFTFVGFPFSFIVQKLVQVCLGMGSSNVQERSQVSNSTYLDYLENGALPFKKDCYYSYYFLQFCFVIILLSRIFRCVQNYFFSHTNATCRWFGQISYLAAE